MSMDNLGLVQRELYGKLGIEPTEAQWNILNDRHRIKLVAGGERAGKSLVDVLDGLPKLFIGDLFWLVGADYESTRGEWNHLVDILGRLDLLEGEPSKNIDPGVITMKGGAEIHTKSAKYPQKIATVAPDGIMVCEAAQVDWETYQRLRGRIAEKRGWMNLASTFEASLGWFPELFTRWQSFNNEDAKSFSLPTWSNLAVYPGGRQDPEIVKLEEQSPREIFQERYGGIPCPPTGLVIKEFSNHIHVGHYSFDPELDVKLAVDPGYAGAHSVLVIQEWGEQIVLIDEVYLRGYVTDEIIDICRQKPWWSKVTDGAIDIAAKQHQAMEAPVEIWLKKGRINLKAQKVPIEDGIDLLRTYLKPNPITGQPPILVDAKCQGFISECGGGKSPVEGGGPWLRDSNTNKAIDRNNHATKALIYYLVNRFGYVGKRGKIPNIKLTGNRARRVFTRT